MKARLTLGNRGPLLGQRGIHKLLDVGGQTHHRCALRYHAMSEKRMTIGELFLRSPLENWFQRCPARVEFLLHIDERGLLGLRGRMDQVGEVSINSSSRSLICRRYSGRCPDRDPASNPEPGDW